MGHRQEETPIESLNNIYRKAINYTERIINSSLPMVQSIAHSNNSTKMQKKKKMLLFLLFSKPSKCFSVFPFPFSCSYPSFYVQGQGFPIKLKVAVPAVQVLTPVHMVTWGTYTLCFSNSATISHSDCNVSIYLCDLNSWCKNSLCQ